MQQAPSSNNPIAPIAPAGSPRFAFFGTSAFSVFVLEELEKRGLLPSLLVCAPDAPQGRKLIMTPPVTKPWAEVRGIETFQPEKLDLAARKKLREGMHGKPFDCFIVASYGLIIPQKALDIPQHGALNVHPSLLPDLRGPSPVQTAILEDKKETGVTIILMDSEVDHGPIIAQEKADIPASAWPLPLLKLKELLGHQGGKLLAEKLPDWLAGKITAQVQNEDLATFTKKIEKKDGQLSFPADGSGFFGKAGYENFLKIRAYDGWPGTYFFIEKPAHGKEPARQIRVLVKDADYGPTSAHPEGELRITRVVPEGRSEMSWTDFQNGQKRG